MLGLSWGEGNVLVISDSGGNGDPITVSFQSAVQAAIILAIDVAIVLSNLLVISALIASAEARDPMGNYLLSLAVADLLSGILIIPLSVYPAVAKEWVYGEIVCRIEGYLQATLWTVTVYSLMWMSVDRYVAIRKPLRYDTIQTRTRCQCWVLFTWVTAGLLCCPPILGKNINPPLFYKDAAICMLDWGGMAAYSLTLAALVLGPSLCTMVYVYCTIFLTMRKVKSKVNPPDKEYVSALMEAMSHPYHAISFAVIAAFWISWTPWVALQVYERVVDKVDSPMLHFGLAWLGVLNSLWKSLIYCVVSPDFRCGLRVFCATICCRSSSIPLRPSIES